MQQVADNGGLHKRPKLVDHWFSLWWQLVESTVLCKRHWRETEDNECVLQLCHEDYHWFIITFWELYEADWSKTVHSAVKLRNSNIKIVSC